MTMFVRVTNESAGTAHDALVRVYNTPPSPNGDTTPLLSEDTSASRVLPVGASVQVMIHAHRFFTVEEVPAALLATANA
jgi:hypothetical protein